MFSFVADFQDRSSMNTGKKQMDTPADKTHWFILLIQSLLLFYSGTFKCITFCSQHLQKANVSWTIPPVRVFVVRKVLFTTILKYSNYDSNCGFKQLWVFVDFFSNHKPLMFKVIWSSKKNPQTNPSPLPNFKYLTWSDRCRELKMHSKSMVLN